MPPPPATNPDPPPAFPGWRQGVADSVSLMLGYFPVAVSFGILAARQGLSPAEALLVSAAVYAGASQFALVSLLAAGASLWAVVGAVAAMNLRHLFYGPALVPLLRGPGRRLPRPLLAFGLTDEVFALAAGTLTLRHRESWLLGVQAGAYGAWLAGTIVGAVAAQSGAALWPGVDAALSFVLPALFLALLLRFARRHHLPALLLAAVGAVLLTRLLPGHLALLAAMTGGSLLAALRPDEAAGRGREGP